MLGLEHGNEILVAEFVLRTVGGDVVPVLFRIFPIHVARIPLVAERGNGIDAPVNEDSELSVFVPIGGLVFL